MGDRGIVVTVVLFRRRVVALSMLVVASFVAGCFVGTTKVGSVAFEAGPAPGPAQSSPAPGGPVAAPSRVAWEGGPAYYAAFPQMRDAGWTDPAFFPIGTWFEAVTTPDDVESDRSAGINTYVEITENSDMALVRAGGMFAFTGGPRINQGAETVAWVLEDEADMYAGPGYGEWTGNFAGEGPVCNPENSPCGYTIMKTRKGQHPADGRAHYANYGKGVFMWETDAEAAPFVNDFPDIVSTDIYWYTDPGICGIPSNNIGIPTDQCRRAANYGAVIDRERFLDGLDGRRQPIYAFVETGAPFTDGGTITPEQVAGAVVNSLIHEARGIFYFNYSYGGPCGTTVLRDPCGVAVRPVVARVNDQIRRLAPVLNTQSFVAELNPQLDTMTKQYDGAYYVFSMLGRGTAPGRHTLTLPRWASGSSAEVLFENRTLPISSGELTDEFAAETAYHIYKITP